MLEQAEAAATFCAALPQEHTRVLMTLRDFRSSLDACRAAQKKQAAATARKTATAARTRAARSGRSIPAAMTAVEPQTCSDAGKENSAPSTRQRLPAKAHSAKVIDASGIGGLGELVASRAALRRSALANLP